MATLVLASYLPLDLISLVCDYIVNACAIAEKHHRHKGMLAVLSKPVVVQHFHTCFGHPRIRHTRIKVEFILNVFIRNKFVEQETLNELTDFFHLDDLYSSRVLAKRMLYACISFYLEHEDDFEEMNTGYVESYSSHRQLE